MFKRVFLPVLLVLGVAFALVSTLGFLVWKSQEADVVYETVSPEPADIVLKTVATGALVPRTEVALKSRVSGVVHALLVEPGDLVEVGDLVAEIRVIPDSAALNRASTGLRAARIQLENAQEELERARKLAGSQAISATELEQRRVAYELAQHEHDAAVSDLQIVRDGATRGAGQASTQVRSTVAGMVLAVDVEVGESVTETNTFNAGTTIGSVADMGDMVFEGTVDESEVGKLSEGMGLELLVGALQDRRFAATLEYISPKGLMLDGAVQFEIRAALEPVTDAFVRAGSSANADIVLDRRTGVLSIDERVLQFEEGEPFVEVEEGNQRFVRREVELGLSDGVRIEVLSGLTVEDRVKASPE